MSKRSHSHNDLADAYARARAARGLPNATDEVDFICPQCGYQGSEDSFDEVEEPDTDSDSDGDDSDSDAGGFRTDPVTSTSTGNADDVNEGDAAEIPKWDNKVALARAIARDLAAGSTNKGNK